MVSDKRAGTPAVISFKDTVSQEPQETNREPLEDGMSFTIEKIIISTKTRYDEIAKFNGYIADETGAPVSVKYRTTSKVIVKQAQDMLKAYGDNDGNINPRVSVAVEERVSDNKGPKGERITYLTFI